MGERMGPISRLKAALEERKQRKAAEVTRLATGELTDDDRRDYKTRSIQAASMASQGYNSFDGFDYSSGILTNFANLQLIATQTENLRRLTQDELDKEIRRQALMDAVMMRLDLPVALPAPTDSVSKS